MKKVGVVANFDVVNEESSQAFLTALGLAERGGYEVHLVEANPLNMLLYEGELTYDVEIDDDKEIKVTYYSKEFPDFDSYIFHSYPSSRADEVADLGGSKVSVIHVNPLKYAMFGKAEVLLAMERLNEEMDKSYIVDNTQEAYFPSSEKIHLMIDQKGETNNSPEFKDLMIAGEFDRVNNCVPSMLATKYLPDDVSLTLYGKGENKDLYRKVVHEYNLYGSVMVKDALNSSMLREAMRNSMLYLHTTMGRSIDERKLEAMDMGIPVIDTSYLHSPLEIAGYIKHILENYDSSRVSLKPNHDFRTISVEMVI